MGLFLSYFRNLGAPSFPRFWERVGILLLVLTGLALAQPPLTDPAKLQSRTIENMQNFTVDKLYMTRGIGGTTWSPDGKQIAFVSNISGRNNLWLVPSNGGWPSQLTISEQRQTQPAWSPDGAWIAYASDYDGNEQWDIFLASPKTGEVVNLTTTKEISEQSPTWSPDSKQIAYIAKPKSGASYEIELMDVYSRRVKHLTQNTPKGRTNRGPIFSRDGKFLVYTQTDANDTDARVFLLDLATGKATNLTPVTGEHTFFASSISPDGKSILLTTNSFNGYDNVGLLDIATQKVKEITDARWEIRAGEFSPDGSSVSWASNFEGNTTLSLYDLASSKEDLLPLGPGVNTIAGNPSPFSPDGSHLLYYHNGPTSPNDVWTYDLKSKATRRSPIR